MKYKNVTEAIKQLEKCKFIDEQNHPIENNTAFVYLKELELSDFSFDDVKDYVLSKGFGLHHINEKEQTRIKAYRDSYKK